MSGFKDRIITPTEYHDKYIELLVNRYINNQVVIDQELVELLTSPIDIALSCYCGGAFISDEFFEIQDLDYKTYCHRYSAIKFLIEYCNNYGYVLQYGGEIQ